MLNVDLEKIKQLRIKAGLTQEDVARHLGYKTSLGYHYIETGRCSLKADHIVKLSELYDIGMEELFFKNNTTNTVV